MNALMPDCDGAAAAAKKCPTRCDATSALVVATRASHTCPDCGNTVHPTGAAFPRSTPANDADAPESHVELVFDLRDVLPEDDVGLAIAELELAHRWRVDHHSVRFGGDRTPLARLQAEADGADTDATARQVRDLAKMLAAPTSGVGQRAHGRFMLKFYDHCARAERMADEDVDWELARAMEDRLNTLEPWERAALRALSRRCTARVSWEEAALAVADELAPPALRALWERTARTGLPGRPRRDPLLPPPEAERIAWGGDVLRAALEAWARARHAGA